MENEYLKIVEIICVSFSAIELITLVATVSILLYRGIKIEKVFKLVFVIMLFSIVFLAAYNVGALLIDWNSEKNETRKF